MAKKSIAFIVNPISGTQDKESILELIRKHLDAEKFDYQVARTQYAGHASSLAKAFVEEGRDAVVAIGGDGTVNEIARALVHTPVALGVIPAGPATGWPATCAFRWSPWGAIKVLNRFDVECLDYGKINDVPFFFAPAGWASTPS